MGTYIKEQGNIQWLGYASLIEADKHATCMLLQDDSRRVAACEFLVVYENCEQCNINKHAF